MLKRLLSAAALVLVAGSAWAQFPDSLDPFNKGAVCGAPCTIKNNIFAYYKLEEASGTRVDSVAGTYNLTATNTPGNTTGKVGNAMTTVAASSQYGVTSVNVPLASGDFSVVCWGNLTTKGANRSLWSTAGTTLAQLNYAVAADRFRFSVGGTNSTATTFGSPSTSTWYLIATTYVASTTTGCISINAGSFDCNAAMTPAATSGILRVGANTAPSVFWDGAIDECGVWGRALSAPEVTYLYNSGSGRTLY